MAGMTGPSAVRTSTSGPLPCAAAVCTPIASRARTIKPRRNSFMRRIITLCAQAAVLIAIKTLKVSYAGCPPASAEITCSHCYPGERSRPLGSGTCGPAPLHPYNEVMKRIALISGLLGPVLFAGMVIVLTVVEYDFLRTLGWDSIRRPTVDWPSGL